MAQPAYHLTHIENFDPANPRQNACQNPFATSLLADHWLAEKLGLRQSRRSTTMPGIAGKLLAAEPIHLDILYVNEDETIPVGFSAVDVVKEEEGDDSPKITALHLRHLEIRPDYRGSKLGDLLIRNLFWSAAKKDAEVSFTPFTKDGKRHLAPAAARIHTGEFPDLNVCYSGQTSPIDGKRPYRLGFGPLYWITASTKVDYI